MITYFNDKNRELKKKYKNYKTLTTILELVDTVAIVATTTTSVTLSVSGVGLIVVLISAGIVCALSLGNKIMHERVINKYNKWKTKCEND